MTIITGSIADSGGVPFGATLTVTLDAPLLGSEGKLLTRKPREYAIASTGLISLNLPESETAQVTYKFELKVGESYIVPPFHAIVPNVETVDFWELFPISALTDLLPAGLRRLAQIIATNPQYAEAVKGFRPEGNYNPDTFYSKGAIVAFSGGSYLYVAETLQKEKTPSLFNGSVAGNTVYWQTIAEKGQTNGLAPNNDTFNAIAWNGNFLAPTKNSLANVVTDRRSPRANAWNFPNVSSFTGDELLCLADLLTHFALKRDAVLTGDPKAPTKGVGDNTTSIATTAHVKTSIDALAAVYLTQTVAASTYLTQNTASSTYLTAVTAAATYAPIASAALTGNPTAPTQTYANDSTRIATTAFVRQHEAWTSILPAGWTGYWKIRRQADGSIEMVANAIATGVTIAAFTASGTLLTLATQYRSTSNLSLPSVFRIDGGGYAAGFIEISSAGVVTAICNLAVSNQNFYVRGSYTWSPSS